MVAAVLGDIQSAAPTRPGAWGGTPVACCLDCSRIDSVRLDLIRLRTKTLNDRELMKPFLKW